MPREPRVFVFAALLITISLLVSPVLARPAAAGRFPLETSDQAAIDAYIQSRMRAARIPGLALGVVRSDQVVYLKGYGLAGPDGGTVTPRTPFILGSTSKSITALAVMQLVEAGRINLIQTGTVAIKQRQRAGVGHAPVRLIATLLAPQWTPSLPIYAWVIEHPEGLIVVDTGETARAVQPGYFPAWNPYYRFGVREQVQPEDEIGSQLHALGLSPDDVRWVVLTHLHTDHAGGLAHFPHAEVLLSRTAYDTAAGLMEQLRGALPQHWPSWFAPRLVQFDDEAFGPFARSRRLTRAGDVSLVPTPGHSPGHLSVIVQEPEQLVFLAGDTSYTEELLLAGVVDGVSADPLAAQQTLRVIQRLTQSTPTVYLPSHDPNAARRLTLRQVTPTVAATA
jgi:glyoxylase-like metal-dependent hydrolase (beta-lactamase superfamily II)